MPQPNPAAVQAVAIGASAGGVDVLRRILRMLPQECRASVLVALHVPTGGSASLVELLRQSCALPVTEALDKQPIGPGQVIVAPADYHMLVEPDRTIALSVDPPVLHSRPAIDPLFDTAAVAYGRRLLAVLLSGASCDGTAGLLAVRARGGTAWVQDPATEYASMMPKSALARAGADLVLGPDQLASELAKLGAT